MNLAGVGRRFLIVFCVAFTVLVLVVMFTPVANYMARPLVVAPKDREADLIVVLGGGVFPNGLLGGGSNERLIHGLLLYKEGRAPKIIFSGGSIIKTSAKILHTITRSEDTSRIDAVEADIMKDISVRLGIPAGDLSVDGDSIHTYGNLAAVKGFMETRGLKSCLIVTSPTHILRSMKVSGKLGLDCYPAPVGDYTPHIRGSTGRLSLMRAVLWEYAALGLYKAYGYI
ncbi:MAG: YdcF family protein [Thermodesulfobacteriota bacterium]